MKNLDLPASSGSDDLLVRVAVRWQERATRPLSREDAREILENLGGFVRTLQEWEAAEPEVEEK